jgi:hypothetical protein
MPDQVLVVGVAKAISASAHRKGVSLMSPTDRGHLPSQSIVKLALMLFSL